MWGFQIGQRGLVSWSVSGGSFRGCYTLRGRFVRERVCYYFLWENC